MRHVQFLLLAVPLLFQLMLSVASRMSVRGGMGIKNSRSLSLLRDRDRALHYGTCRVCTVWHAASC